jgi:hypothetical protein
MANNNSLVADHFDRVVMWWRVNNRFSLSTLVCLRFNIPEPHILHMDWVACAMGVGIGVIAMIGIVVHVFYIIHTIYKSIEKVTTASTHQLFQISTNTFYRFHNSKQFSLKKFDEKVFYNNNNKMFAIFCDIYRCNWP